MNQNTNSNTNPLTEEIRTRLEVWRERLIDLSFRNQSINFKEYKTSTFKIDSPDYETLIKQLLIEGKSFRPVKEIIDELKEDEILVSSEATDQETPLINLTRAYKTSKEDMGVNVVHVAIGFLEWYERNDSEIPIKSPIILLPVHIYKSQTITETQLPFRLRADEDELLINKAILERLKRDFLIEIDSELDDDDPINSVKECFEKFEEIANSNNGWTVTKDVHAGNFNYYGFPIYADLKNLEGKLLDNHLIRALISTEPFEQDISSIVQENELDEKVDPKETFQILDADSSQQKAISAAKGNISFVIQGPPGTGKSQTIGNIISECLSQNKKVLFVSAKEVALKVVKNRLDAKQIGQFCLNLHDYKKKNLKELFEDIDRTWSAQPYSIEEEEIDDDLSRLSTTRKKLNEYVLELSSKKTKLEVTPYKVHGEISILSDIPINIFDVPNTNEISRQKLRDILSEIKNLEDYAHILSEHDLHVWYDSNVKQIGVQKKEELTSLLQDINEKLTKLKNGINELHKSTPVILKLCTKTNEFIDFGKKYKLSVLKEDINGIRQQIKSFDGNILRYFDSNYSNQLKLLKSHLKDDQKLDSNIWWWRFAEKTVLSDLNKANDVKINCFEDLNKIDDLNENHQSIIEKWIDDFGELPDQVIQKIQELTDLLKDANTDTNYYDDISDALTKIENKQNNLEALDKWIRYKKIINKLGSLGVNNFVEKAIQEKFHPDKLVKIFRKRFYSIWLDNVESENTILREFDSTVMHNLIGEFRKLDKQQLNYAVKRITNKIVTNFPSRISTNTSNTGIAMLLQQINRSRAHLSMRRLLKTIPDIILSIKPCLMMSPRTVSTYLGDNVEFDVVIFDEASQILPEEALGSIVRAKQMIIAGDQKQLPPTNFFRTQSVEVNDEIAEDIEGFDSILDLACATTIPNILLNWHYRSQSENLIQFSNHHFYNNKLQIFPASNKDGNKGVFFNLVNEGKYDYGKSKTNRVEADLMVQRLFEKLENMDGDTIGIVTFNIAQRDYIDNKINMELNNYPQLQEWFSRTGLNEFFVKNLESVQGDERDIIFFSMLYGKDNDGRPRGPYGAIQNTGGEKRLNVAVTRAKKRVEVFSSMTANDWDVRNRPEGIKRFKDYLNYAQYGTETLGRGAESTGGEVESPFEEAVKIALENKGYLVEPQVGVGGYRIDLAIIDENEPGRYILGIECDGATYHSSYSARTRDRLRQEILEGKYGWRIHRIWSRDWVRNQADQLEKIKEAIDRPTESTLTNINKEEPIDEIEFVESDPQNISEIIRNKCDHYVMQDEAHYEKYSQIAGYQNYTSDGLKKVVEHFLGVNGPVSKEKLIKVLANCSAMTNISKNFKVVITQQLKDVSEKANFHFNVNTGTISIRDLSKTWHNFIPRFNKSGYPENDRQYDQIPIEELAAVSREILKLISPFKFDDLVIETARVCGFRVASSNLKDRFGKSIKWAIGNGFFTISDDSSVSYVQKN